MVRIEPVAPADRRRALAVLVGEGRHAGRSVETFEAALASRGADATRLWWARSLRGPQAAAVTIRSAGRTAMLYAGPPWAGDPGGSLPELLRAAVEAALAEGLYFVQALLPRDDPAPAFVAAGFRRLAELIYMQRYLAHPVGPESGRLTWRALADAGEAELGRVIQDTYIGSADCPGLLGLRRVEDVIASHKASGRFCPQSWWLPAAGEAVVGCILINDAAEGNGSEVVYLGIRPAFRRQGFARDLLRHALADAARRGRQQMLLAVDAANLAAVRLYEQEGFVQTERRAVFIRTPAPPTPSTCG